MKKISILSFMLLSVIVIIPLFAGIKNRTHKVKNTETTASSTDEVNTFNLTSQEIDYILCEAMMYIDQNTHSETKKALVALCRNNYLYMKENGITPNELKIDNYSDDLLKELKKILLNINLSVKHDGVRVYIPINSVSSGYTATDDEYPYLSSMATPWDVLHKDFNKNSPTSVGLSVAGLNYLSEMGYDYIYTLRWYLNKVNIET